jgi:hypothetical protein
MAIDAGTRGRLSHSRMFSMLQKIASFEDGAGQKISFASSPSPQILHNPGIAQAPQGDPRAITTHRN